jgi:phosphopantetheinyl transferase
MIELWVEVEGGGGASSHDWLRHLVAPLLAVEPCDVPLHRDADGGLSLPATGLQVSLSHHEAWQALAASFDDAVGVDVLTVPENADFVDATALVLSADEIEWVRTQPRALQGAAFAECWVRKEAYAKLRRTGLTPELPTLTFTPEPSARSDVSFWTAHIDDAYVAVATAASCSGRVRLHRRVDSVAARPAVAPP